MAVLFCSIQTVAPAILDIIYPLDDPRPKNLCYYISNAVNHREHFYFFLTHSIITVQIGHLTIWCMDTPYVMCVEHVLALFEIVG